MHHTGRTAESTLHNLQTRVVAGVLPCQSGRCVSVQGGRKTPASFSTQHMARQHEHEHASVAVKKKSRRRVLVCGGFVNVTTYSQEVAGQDCTAIEAVQCAVLQ